jgi:recombination protein RecT
MSETENTPAPRSSAKLTIRDRLNSDDFRDAVSKALPKHLTPERFLRVAITALTKTPKLAQCDQASFFGALLTLSQYGLEPDGRCAHLIPYGTTCQLILDYKGIVELVMRSGKVSKIHADVVCEADEFAYNLGEIQTHKIDLRQPRGEVYAAYAMCLFKDGATACALMSKDEIEAIRARSKSGRSGPWVTDWNEMAKKTAFRRLSKWLPLSSEVRDLMEKDDDVIDIPSRRGGAEPARAHPINPFELGQGSDNDGAEGEES